MAFEIINLLSYLLLHTYSTVVDYDVFKTMCIVHSTVGINPAAIGHVTVTLAGSENHMSY